MSVIHDCGKGGSGPSTVMSPLEKLVISQQLLVVNIVSCVSIGLELRE